MRHSLKKLKKRHLICTAIVLKFGVYNGKDKMLLGEIVCLEHDSPNRLQIKRVVAHHCWTDRSTNPEVDIGDRISFGAKVVAYEKTRGTGETYRDFKVGKLSRIKILESHAIAIQPTNNRASCSIPSKLFSNLSDTKNADCVRDRHL